MIPLNKYFPFSIVLLFCLSMSVGAFAQTLPNKQISSLHAPPNVKIDGKSTEWGGKMMAYNKATEIFYTIANDDKRLYLIVQSKDQNQMSMLIRGITLIVQANGKYNDSEAARIKFPYLENPNQMTWFQLTPAAPEGFTGPVKDPDGKKAEAVIRESNKGLKTLSKWIHARGISGKDSILSVYNEAGIEAANGFSNDKVYTSELAIDLEVLGLQTGRPAKFSYHILVNGEPNRFKGVTGFRQRYRPSRDQTQAQVDEIIAKREADAAAAAATTEFWGDYTLSK